MIDWNDAYQTGQYKHHWEYSHPSQEISTAVAGGLVPAQSRVLEIGCGSGRDAVFMAQLNYRVIGTDISEAALAVARQLAHAAGVTVGWQAASATDLPLPDACIDFISDKGCLHHLRGADRVAYFHEAARVLRPNGRLLLRGAREGDGGFLEPITAEGIDPHLAAHGLQRGPLVAITLPGDSGREMAAVITLIEKNGRR